MRSNLVVNYHFLRTCNYACKFCFHVAKTSRVASIEDAIDILKDAGMTRINFSGGEPFLKPKMLGQMITHAYENGISPSVVSNGSLIREKWMNRYGHMLDAVAISCDSFDPVTLFEIGRYAPSRDHLQQMQNVREWCNRHGILFKINTVVCQPNKNEILHEIEALQPDRWKVFQCLLIDGENSGPEALANGESMVVSDEEFESFTQRHSHIPHVAENNATMRNSYIILDEDLCLLDNSQGSKRQTVSVLDDVHVALTECGFDADAFRKRSGEWLTEKVVW
jgi:radical S-adenosyl methionine domain-containing protein 2